MEPSVFNYLNETTAANAAQKVEEVYNAIIEGKSLTDQVAIQQALFIAGVDVGPLCKKKHPQ